jgi:alkylation response protein AidB-like acyl-CoA dehydrogenase
MAATTCVPASFWQNRIRAERNRVTVAHGRANQKPIERWTPNPRHASHSFSRESNAFTRPRSALHAIEALGPWWSAKRSPEDIRNIALIKLAGDESYYRITDRAGQLHGGAGIMKDTAINKLFLLERNLHISGGTDEVQRTTIFETLGLRARDR